LCSLSMKGERGGGKSSTPNPRPVPALISAMARKQSATMSKGGPLAAFHPIVQRWFIETLGEPSAPQRLGWPAIGSGSHTLILAPTGTGKTLAAFLWELDRLIARGREAPLPNAIQIVYVSPLKALSNDIHRNLERPLAELAARFEAAGESFPDIRVAVRTGDTPASARARMLRRAPHILITTPESLNIMLTTERGRGMFAFVRAVIVDEIHAVAGSKRGAHLALTLERLEELCERSPQRIGLSATQRPLGEVARFLGGCPRREPQEEPSFRPVKVVDCGLVKRMELSVRSPVADLAHVDGSVWPGVVELVHERIRNARTTLVFVNNRAQSEKIAARINQLAGSELARPYHGSLSRERRHLLERALKAGELPALITTSSLELGIDIGSVDQVLQIQSPKRVASGLQRVGRAGHSLDETSRGVVVPTFRDDLVECAAVVGAMRDGDVEPTQVPQNALDVLAQSVVAIVSVSDTTDHEVFTLVRGAYPYHRLPRQAFDDVLAMLAGKYRAELSVEMQARVTWDRATGRLTAARGSRLMAVVSGGTIPDRGLYTVNLPDRTRLGELDEEFVHESRVGDVFQLGSATWRIRQIEHDRVIVSPAPGAPARMPFWKGEYAARSVELSRRVGALRRELAAAGDDPAVERVLRERYGCDDPSARALREYIGEQRVATGVVPDDGTIVVEHFRDEMDAVRVVVHSVFGGRVNAPWGMAIAHRLRELMPATAMQLQTNDDGIMLRLPDLSSSPHWASLVSLAPSEAEHLVLQEVAGTSLFGARFRMNAARALLLPRGSPRRRMPLWLQRLRALDLLDAVRDQPTFPILIETYRDVLQDAFDMPALSEVLSALAAGRITLRSVETVQPSPFAASLQFGFVMDWLYIDDTPRAEQKAALLSPDRTMLAELLGGERDGGADDDLLRALAELVSERRGTAPGRQARTADELAVLLDRAGDLTVEELRVRVDPSRAASDSDPLAELLRERRAVALRFDSVHEWLVVLAESLPRYASALGAERVSTIRSGEALEEGPATAVAGEALLRPVIEQHAARRELMAGYVALAGPVTASEIEARYGWPGDWIDRRLQEWERAEKLVRGRFRADVREAEWCVRRLVEVARRRALAHLRRQIQAVELPTFAAFLQRWQHLDPRERLSGASGVETVIRQLAGLGRPAPAWDRDYLPARVANYNPALLSQLAASGNWVWMGEARRDSTVDTATLSAVRFFERGNGSLWSAAPAGESAASLSDDARAVVAALRREGASFLPELQRTTGMGAIAIREALRQLVTQGIATNDSVEALREVMRLTPFPDRPRKQESDPTRWLPLDFDRSGRPVVQRRPSIRRLPRWRRPDLPGPASGWVGRWSLLDTPGVRGNVRSEEEAAAEIAQQWLQRYGVVSRDWWRRERPPVSWRAIYHELRRLEMRGDVRRGYFVEGLGGAQFALPDAVERLREVRDSADAPWIVMAASDPANPYSLALDAAPPLPLSRPRGRGALLVTRRGRIGMTVEARGRRLSIAPELTDEEIELATRALAAALTRSHVAWSRSPIVESVNGVPVHGSPHVVTLLRAGLRREVNGLRWEPAV